jgi:hypothetical protein
MMEEQTNELSALDRIEIEAQFAENEHAAKEEAILNPPDENAMAPAIAWAQVPMMLGGILSMAMPELKNVYTEPACMQWGGAMSQVAAKHGWDAQETMAKWGPEIALAMASLPLIAPTVAAIKKKRAEGPENKPQALQNVEALQEGEALPEGGGFEEPK